MDKDGAMQISSPGFAAHQAAWCINPPAFPPCCRRTGCQMICCLSIGFVAALFSIR